MYSFSISASTSNCFGSVCASKSFNRYDFRAIKACKALDIPFVTAIHCLLSLHKNKVIETKIAIEKLKKLEQYGRYKAAIIKDAENKINGEKNG